MYGYPQYSGYQQRRQIVRVNGRAGADMFQMPPNSQDLLLDETAPIIYFVQTDGAGYKTVAAFDLTPHQDETAVDIRSLEQRISALEGAIKHEPDSSSNATDTTDTFS